jgi:copper chaperone CopZ
MTHAYYITNMTCASCEQKVKDKLLRIPEVESVSIDLPTGIATVTMNKHIATATLQQSLKDHPKYQLTEAATEQTHLHNDEATKNWLQTYKPILLLFAFITGITVLIQLQHDRFNWLHWMDNFMAAFFLVFSFFKLLDVKSFAENYYSYDIVAKRWFGWGYVYPFIELALGIAYLVQFNPAITNAVTFIVMGASIIGVLQSVFNKRKIRCACLGAVFNLPMSTITIIEDALMIGTSAIMLITLL